MPPVPNGTVERKSRDASHLARPPTVAAVTDCWPAIGILKRGCAASGGRYRSVGAEYLIDRASDSAINLYGFLRFGQALIGFPRPAWRGRSRSSLILRRGPRPSSVVRSSALPLQLISQTLTALLHQGITASASLEHARLEAARAVGHHAIRDLEEERSQETRQRRLCDETA